MRLPALVVAALIAPVSASLSMAASPIDGSDADKGILVVEFNGMTSDDGRLVFAMWSGPEDWLGDEGSVRSGAVEIETGRSQVVVEGLPYGEYALSAYHDRNDNSELDTGLFGIPKEPIGTSNDAKARFGPPKYDEAKFTLNQPSLTITIVVKKLF